MFVCPVPKISQVLMKWRCRDSLLGRFTFWHIGCRATQLGKFTLSHNGRRAKQPSFSDACTRSCTHFPKTVTNHAEKYEGSIQSKIKSKLLKNNALEDSANTDRQ